MSVVVTSPSAGRVTVLDPRTLRIRRVFTGLGFPHDVEARGRLAFVTDEASWCIPCRDEAPLLNASARAHRGKVVFLGVNVQDLSEDALKFLREFDVPYASVRDRNNKIFEDYGLTGVPETYYLDARGRIVGHVPGAVSRRTLEQGGADQVLSGGRR